MIGRPKKIQSHVNMKPVDIAWVADQIKDAVSSNALQAPSVPDVLLPFVITLSSKSVSAPPQSESKAKSKPEDSIDKSDSDVSNMDVGATPLATEQVELPIDVTYRDPIRFWRDVNMIVLNAVLLRCSRRLTQEDRLFLSTVHQHALDVEHYMEYLWPKSKRRTSDSVTRQYNEIIVSNLSMAIAASHQPATDLPFAAILSEQGQANMSARKDEESVRFTATAIMAFFGPMHGVLMKDSIPYNTWREIVQYITGIDNGSLRRVQADSISVLLQSKIIYENILADINRQLNK